ncbi:glycosyl hydrolase family 61-domain-containing protein [Aspergillus ambiguus]|uniref:glycosyl hydrolase family 61-domain-containing protein n=1 Tax=Aspergillus ambiguus TaxID=176160 RepID=UPI003CCE301A
MFRLLLFFFISVVFCHTTFTTLYVDGVNQGDGVCVRMNRNAETASDPISPLTSRDIACGYDGEKAVSRACPAKASSLLTFEFREYPDATEPGSIDISHKGPCAVYMKKVDDATADNNAAGDGWFKIWHLGYDSAAQKWCTEKLIDNNGFLSVHIPADISAGYYLVRPELLALHNADAVPPDPQFYVGCAQLFVQSDGAAQPSTVSIGEDTYHIGIPGLTFNIYDQPLQLPYPMFGPPVYQANTAMIAKTNVASTQSVQQDGLKPDGCILVRDNWCGFEVPAYDTEDGCWTSSENCWEQSDVCWNTALPTGNSVCQIWQDKCTAIDDACNNGEFNGPPNQGKDLTPALKKIDGSTDVFTVTKRTLRWRRAQ